MSYSSGPDTMPSEFVGQTTATLTQWLADAQLALQQLTMGSNPNAVSYSQGDGSKSVTYQPSDIGMLQNRISSLAYALGLSPRRRAMRPGF